MNWRERTISELRFANLRAIGIGLASLAAYPTPLLAGDVAPIVRREQYPPLYGQQIEEARSFVDRMISKGVEVPVPKDPGGGYTHEQHKRNYRAIYLAGQLYRLTGDRKYANFSRDVLLSYAKLYPTLGEHPAKANQDGGRLFWQVLNDAVWLVYSVQGYEAIRDSLPKDQRKTIDEQVFRKAAHFLSVDSARTFNRIHNHATWAAAGVGMTGYLLGDRDLVDSALRGSDKSGKAGFLRQVDELFSPDGYYAEGPYYQRYALLPFLVFADAIGRNDPGEKIFERRDGVLLKALYATIQLTYAGCFFPMNDALKDKCLRTDELYEGVAIGYGKTRDPGLLSIAEWQGHTVLSPAGRLVAEDLAAGKAKPFPFRTMLLRDGPRGDQGAVAILRAGSGWDGTALIAKNTSQGMGHGHFDKLSWQFYDNGQEIVSDYGAARFLNIEAKEGGRYLPENESWAKQTIAHNTLVVDGQSNFGGDRDKAQEVSPRQLAFLEEGGLQLSAATIAGAFPGVTMTRALALVPVPGLSRPVAVDVLRAEANDTHRYQLPLHFLGHIMRTGFERKSFTGERPVLGSENGAQHIWVDARGTPANGADAFVTWLNGDRFYTARWVPQSGSDVAIGESGANDPEFNLRREPMILQRLRGAKNTTFVTMLETHGSYDAAAEQTSASDSLVADLDHVRSGTSDLVTITTRAGRQTVLAISWDRESRRVHRATLKGHPVEWRGFAGLIELPERTKK